MAFAVTSFLSAFLLFQVQPILGKAVLPWFGGGPAVWTVCLLFFQCLLLGGYGYAHLLATRLAPRAQRRLHLILVGLALAAMALDLVRGSSPILPSSAWKPDDSTAPELKIIVLLAVRIGLPYLVLSSTGPLIQSWFARTRPGVSPYRLYALSNAGSLLALLSYPFVVEPHLTLRAQAITWAVGFVLFAAASAASARRLEAAPPPPAVDDSGAPPAIATRVLWLVLAGCASALLLATTNQMCQSIAPIPFMWIAPLAIYLVTFILCFDSDKIYRRGIFGPLLVLGIAAAAFVVDEGNVAPIRGVIVYGLALFAACMTCHGELVRLRPAPRYLTAFYLSISAGGALGGVFVALIAPRVFDGYWELEGAFELAGVLAVYCWWRDPESWLRAGRAWPALAALIGAVVLAARIRTDLMLDDVTDNPLVVGAVVAAVAAVVATTRKLWFTPGHPRIALACCALALIGAGVALYRDISDLRGDVHLMRRGFYGVLSINEIDPGTRDHRFVLYHGEIIHGVQFQSPDERRRPTTYYIPTSGVGRAITGQADHPLHVGVIGLGAGTIAGYARPGDRFRFYEIDPAVVALSRGPDAVFSFLSDAPGGADIVLGDARLSLERELAEGQPQKFDVLAIDAFSGDAIPIHLLTREAIGDYLAHLAPMGVLAVHVSNKYLDLEQVVAAHVAALHLAARVIDLANSDTDYGSTWVLLARGPEALRRAGLADGSRALGDAMRTWTDDASDLLGVLR